MCNHNKGSERNLTRFASHVDLVDSGASAPEPLGEDWSDGVLGQVDLIRERFELLDAIELSSHSGGEDLVWRAEHRADIEGNKVRERVIVYGRFGVWTESWLWMQPIDWAVAEKALRVRVEEVSGYHQVLLDLVLVEWFNARWKSR